MGATEGAGLVELLPTVYSPELAEEVLSADGRPAQDSEKAAQSVVDVWRRVGGTVCRSPEMGKEQARNKALA